MVELTVNGDLLLNASACPGNCSSPEKGVCSAVVGSTEAFCACVSGLCGPACETVCTPSLNGVYAVIFLIHLTAVALF